MDCKETQKNNKNLDVFFYFLFKTPFPLQVDKKVSENYDRDNYVVYIWLLDNRGCTNIVVRVT